MFTGVSSNFQHKHWPGRKFPIYSYSTPDLSQIKVAEYHEDHFSQFWSKSIVPQYFQMNVSLNQTFWKKIIFNRTLDHFFSRQVLHKIFINWNEETSSQEQFYKNIPGTTWFCKKFLLDLICQLQTIEINLCNTMNFP